MKKVNWDTRKTVIINGEKVTASASMLHRISVCMHESADMNNIIGCHETAKDNRKLGESVYCQLKAMGFYDDIK